MLQLETNQIKQKTITQKSGKIITDILDNGLSAKNSETIIEINLAVLKFKHTMKKG